MADLIPDQSWHNPKSRWRRRVRRYVLLIAGPGGLIILLGLLVAYEEAVRFEEYRDAAIVLTIASVVGGVFLWFGWRERALAKRVVECDGRLCPKCRVGMDAADEHRNRLACAKCGVVLLLGVTQQFWVNHWFNRREARAWQVREDIGRPTDHIVLALWGPSLEDPRVRLGWVLLMAASVAFVIAVFAFVTHPIHAIMLGGLIATAQTVMAWHAVRQARRPSARGRFCAQCDYQLPPPPAEALRCAECGADWTKPGGYYTGNRPIAQSSSRHIVPVAAMILIFGAYVLFMPFGPLGNRLLSTNMLVGAVTRTGDVFIYREWQQLLDRPLTDEQRVTLARGLLARRESRETLEREANAWFAREIEDGTLPSEIVHEYQAGVVVLNVDVPQRVRVGEEVPIRIETLKRYERPAPFTTGVAIAFGGFEVNGEPIGRSERFVGTSSFGSTTVMFGRRDSPRASDRGPIGTFTPAKPGELTLRARYWLLLYPGQLPREPIEWNDDGTPVLPPEAIWVVECSIERTIEVIE